MTTKTIDLGNGRSTTHGYYVEARLAGGGDEPIVVAHTTITTKWRQIHFVRVPPVHDRIGVPSGMEIPSGAVDHGLLSYEAARALMGMVVARLPLSNMLLEFRLRKVKLFNEWHIEDLGVTEPLNFFEAERKEVFTIVEPEPLPEKKA